MNLTKSPVDETPMSPGQKMNFCSLANRVFFNSNLKLNSFVKENFGQETKSMDFVHEVEKSRQAINHWIEQKTNNKIKDLIAPGSINSFTNILIANAIYFQAKWLTQFDPTKTVKGKFQVCRGLTLLIDLSLQVLLSPAGKSNRRDHCKLHATDR